MPTILRPTLQIAATVVSIYTLVCFIRVFLTWIPSAAYSPFGQFLARICDPYLDIFKRLRLRIGRLDLSAAVAICALWGLSYILTSLANGQRITVGIILSLVVGMIWNIFSSVLGFFIFLLIIRLVVLLVSKSTYGTIWDSIDNSISPIIFAMTSMFYRGRSISFKGAVAIALIESVVLYALGKILVEGMLIPILMNIGI
jgi:YggT family protein